MNNPFIVNSLAAILQIIEKSLSKNPKPKNKVFRSQSIFEGSTFWWFAASCRCC